MRPPDALLLTNGGELSGSTRSLARLLKFFGVPWRVPAVAQVLGEIRRSEGAGCRLIAPADLFSQLVEELDRQPELWRQWRHHVHSAFVYASPEHEVLTRLVSRVSSGARCGLRTGSHVAVAVADGPVDVCGVMSGVQCNAAVAADVPVMESLGSEACSLVTLGEDAAFVKVDHEGVPVFISTSSEVIDLDGDLGHKNFDVREHFLESVPAVLYIKWAFRDASWVAPATGACLVIDDPLLRRAYGCIDFPELLAAMQQYRFATNIAFIPWNWRRSRPDAVRLFLDNPDRFSLSVHGCDHTGGEFGASDAHVLNAKAKLALERMRSHESTTGIHHDEVMVFPQGVFSSAAMEALKHSNYVAAVNTELASTDASPTTLKVSDAWDVAVTCYGFPLFTRRYPRDEVVNFAFDALLGKPIIIVTHHDFWGDGGAQFVRFVESLNGLKTTLTWRSLGEVVRRSHRWRQVEVDVVDVEMYGNELRLDNSAARRMRFHVAKCESDPSGVKAVHAGARTIPFEAREGRLRWDLELEPGDSVLLRVQFDDRASASHRPAPLPQRVKTGLRRYLSEARDNYIVTGKIRLAGVLRSARDTHATRS